ncbi:MAG: DUF2568 domain-containing protein [Coprobacillaceae bacterium]
MAIIAPLIVMIIWGIWCAPSSSRRLQGSLRLIIEIMIYVIVTICLYNTDYIHYTLLYLMIALANASINYFTNWLI